MIVLDQVSLSVPVHRRGRASFLAKTRPVLESVSLVIPSDRHIALISQSPEDSSTVIDMLGGVIVPGKGRIQRAVRVSFPVGHLGSFDPDLTVRKNVAHLARLYAQDVDHLVAITERVAHLGEKFNRPFGHLSRVEMTRLASIVAYALPFDLYVLGRSQSNLMRNPNDSVTALFQHRARRSGLIIPTRSVTLARTQCEMALLLNRGQLRLFERVEDALALMQEQRLHRRSRREAAVDDEPSKNHEEQMIVRRDGALRRERMKRRAERAAQKSLAEK